MGRATEAAEGDAMSEPLTRNQLEQECMAFYNTGEMTNIRHILAHDAALRAQLTVLENDKAFLVQERLTLLEAFTRLAADVDLSNEKQAQRQVADLTAQLAQAHQQLDDAKGSGADQAAYLNAQLAEATSDKHTWWEKFAACDRQLAQARQELAHKKETP